MQTVWITDSLNTQKPLYKQINGLWNYPTLATLLDCPTRNPEKWMKPQRVHSYIRISWVGSFLLKFTSTTTRLILIENYRAQDILFMFICLWSLFKTSTLFLHWFYRIKLSLKKVKDLLLNYMNYWKLKDRFCFHFNEIFKLN